MSLEAAKAFVERMKNDEDFRKKVNECKDNEARKAFVLKDGFEFTAEELKQVGDELSDGELNLVVGSGTARCDLGHSLCLK